MSKSHDASAGEAPPKQSVFRRISKLFTSAFKREEEPEPVFEISAPYNFKHLQHVKADPHSSTGFSVSERVCFHVHICVEITAQQIHLYHAKLFA